MKKVGTRVEVWNGKALKTVSGLKKDAFMLNKRNKVVSKARSLASQKNIGRLQQFQFKKMKKDKKNAKVGAPEERQERNSNSAPTK